MSTPYDEVNYPNSCHPQSHPTRLAVIGRLFGLDPAPPERCRLLEIGAGDGTNLFQIAEQFPESQFEGIDLASTVVERGRRFTTELNLSNLRLDALDMTNFPLEGPPYDYIIAHGVYSWVPAHVRDSMMAICRARLAPQGIAFISYNCLPGCHIRRMAWEIMKFHTRGMEDPRLKVQQAFAITKLIANSIHNPDTFRKLFKEQLEQMTKYGPGHLFHDDLSANNDPIYFHQFMEHASRHGLQFLGEADFFEMQDLGFTGEARAALGEIVDSRLTREQYLDFIKCRRFRQTLLCHHENPLQTSLHPKAIETFHIASLAARDPAGSSTGNPEIERYKEPKGGALELDYPPARSAFRLFETLWPATISFPELCSAVCPNQSWTTSEGSKIRENLQAILLEAYRAGVVEFFQSPVRCAATPSERPKVSRLARWQVERGLTLTTLRGENLRVQDEQGKRILGLLDGSRGLNELDALMGAPTDGPDAPSTVLEQLNELARLALLES